jgi:hypothetical protein
VRRLVVVGAIAQRKGDRKKSQSNDNAHKQHKSSRAEVTTQASPTTGSLLFGAMNSFWLKLG